MHQLRVRAAIAPRLMMKRDGVGHRIGKVPAAGDEAAKQSMVERQDPRLDDVRGRLFVDRIQHFVEVPRQRLVEQDQADVVQ